MKQLKERVCDESAVTLLWKHCGLKWEELGVKGEGIKDLLTKEVSYLCMPYLTCVSLPLLLSQKLGFLLPRTHLNDLISQFQSINTTIEDIIKWIDVSSHVTRHMISHVIVSCPTHRRSVAQRAEVQTL